jgi:uncharacterized protein (UPF0261 family)
LSVIGLTTLTPFTQPAAEAARHLLEEHGHSVIMFETNGTGGRALETAAREGRLHGVLDLTLAELAAELVGGPAGAGPDRFTAASLLGLPQVICFGGLDLIDLGSGDSLPKRFQGRRWSRQAGAVLLRTNLEENDTIGKEIAYKSSASAGPVAACIPWKGLSSLDVAGRSFWWPEADRALIQSFFNWTGPQVTMKEFAAHINDAVFAGQAARTLMEMLSAREERDENRRKKAAHE